MNIHKKSFISVAWEQRCIENDTLKNRYTYAYFCVLSKSMYDVFQNELWFQSLSYNISNTLLT